MKIDEMYGDEAVLAELGRRIARTRLEQNMTQERLAYEAGVSRPTVQRMEARAPVKLDVFIRILRALQILSDLDHLVPEPLPSPIERMKLHGRERRRATSS